MSTNLSPLEQQVLSYYVENAADRLDMVGRFWPYGELGLIVEDKVQLAVGKFGMKAKMASPKAARVFVDLMIARGGFSSVDHKLGGTMHQHQGPAYVAAVKQLQEADPIIQKARAAGADYWKESFTALTTTQPSP